MRGARWMMRALLLCLTAGLLAGPAAAQGVFAGTWQVVDAQPAPWVDGTAATQPDVDKALTHARITFRKDRVDAPSPLGCRKATYELSNVGPDYIFQGGLKDPARQAEALGFKGAPIVNLNLGCASSSADLEMDFALADRDTAFFALNNVLYKMSRKKP
jgi:hypothetical protein